ncbi:MAG: glycosyltransferase [Candidatus Omnitrophica bacterium]|nr:glycosyltransferase [Candidatus Omnitrophota bacterium]
MTVSVIVATYGRPAYLEKCLNSLLVQRRMPEEIIVVTHEADKETHFAVEKIKQSSSRGNAVKQLRVSRADIVYAENRGLESASGEIVCFIDDDGVAGEDWIARIVGRYEADSGIGGVGGPVIPVVLNKPVVESTDIFAKITWYGKRITNASKVPGSVQEADSLAGCNMSFRRSLVGKFDERLLPYWRRFEDDACQSVKEAGYKVICDPDLRVLHFAANVLEGFGPDQTIRRIIGLHHNSIYVKLKHSKGSKKIIVFFYEFFWGDDTSPGLYQFIFYAVSHLDLRRLLYCVYALTGKLLGVYTYLFKKQKPR